MMAWSSYLTQLTSLLLFGVHSSSAECRCVPPHPCWSEVPWAKLNASVSGRLSKSVDSLQVCIDDVKSSACTVALNNTDDEFWLGSTPNGYQHTGLFGGWNTSAISEYAVTAETEQDFVETVRFAGMHNLRLVVKATGHDWYGRSTAPGSLLLWTHTRKRITWHTTFPAPEGGVPAVTVESGVQFSDLYPLAQQQPYPGDTASPPRKTIVMGGTCDSVGVGGCWLGGCFGPFTKLFGNGAVNLLQAKVVLPNGSLVTCSEARHPDVFWTLRGGGGGNIAVVTSFTARTHPAPNHMVTSSFTGRAPTPSGYRALMDRVLQVRGPSHSPSLTPAARSVCPHSPPTATAHSHSPQPPPLTPTAPSPACCCNWAARRAGARQGAGLVLGARRSGLRRRRAALRLREPPPRLELHAVGGRRRPHARALRAHPGMVPAARAAGAGDRLLRRLCRELEPVFALRALAVRTTPTARV